MQSDQTTTVQYLKEQMKTFVRDRDWEQYHTSKNLASSVAIEAAELLELFQWLTVEDAQRLSLCDEELRVKIADEMSDVLLYLISLANVLNIDISSSVKSKLEKNASKYPRPVTDSPEAIKQTSASNSRS